MHKKLIATLAMVLAGSTAALADASDGKVKIGILNDQSGVYADFGGKSSYEAALMAVEDFGGKVLGVPVEVVTADHQNKPISPPTLRGNGTTPSRSTASWS